MRLPTARNQIRKHAGFTLMELLVVVAVMIIITGFTAPMMSTSLFERDAMAAAAGAADALREGQSAVMSGRDGSRYGVHFEAGRFVLFQGASYVPADPDNAVHTLDGGVAISAITLTGGGSDVHFSDHRGTPTEYGTITFRAATGKISTVTIGQAGMLDAN